MRASARRSTSSKSTKLDKLNFTPVRAPITTSQPCVRLCRKNSLKFNHLLELYWKIYVALTHWVCDTVDVPNSLYVGKLLGLNYLMAISLVKSYGLDVYVPMKIVSNSEHLRPPNLATDP